MSTCRHCHETIAYSSARIGGWFHRATGSVICDLPKADGHKRHTAEPTR